MEIKDERELKLFEKELENYELAGAICSYGDVIDFVEGEKSGIVIIDTCGHRKDSGEKMAAFLQQEISQGWGITGDARSELSKLGEKLAAKRDPKIIAEHGKHSYWI